MGNANARAETIQAMKLLSCGEREADVQAVDGALMVYADSKQVRGLLDFEQNTSKNGC